MADRAVEQVRALLLSRSEVGLKKYGCTTDRTDLNLADWQRHALEEALDLAVYLQRALHELERRINADDLNQLAIDWLDCSDADERDADRASAEAVRERMRAYASVRRNCAWELRRLLRQLDKENPPSGGPLVSRADHESA